MSNSSLVSYSEFEKMNYFTLTGLDFVLHYVDYRYFNPAMDVDKAGNIKQYPILFL